MDKSMKESFERSVFIRSDIIHVNLVYIRDFVKISVREFVWNFITDSIGSFIRESVANSMRARIMTSEYEERTILF
jgi:hypothetical protein